MQKPLFALCSLVLCLLPFNTHAMDNTELRNTTVVAGLLTGFFALYQREHFKPCEGHVSIEYQSGNDRLLHSDSVRTRFMDCPLNAPDVLGSDLSFSVLPTGFVSHWHTNSGSYGHTLYELGFVPIGRFSKPVGAVLLDASFGLGVDLLSRANIGIQQKSTLFQFTDELGVGISDLKQRTRVSLSFRHISNLDLQTPNNSANFVSLGISYSFD